MSTLANQRRQKTVVLAHPGTQYSYETALALQEAGLLAGYITGFYYKPQSTLARALRLLPNGRRAQLEREFLRRFKPGLASKNIRTFPLLELPFVASSRLRSLRCFSDAVLRWRNRQFESRLVALLDRERPAAVVCYDTSAQRTFERAKSLGISCVLDQSIAHLRTGLRLLREEAELQPDFADSLPTKVPEWLVEQCSQEALLAECVLSPSEYVRQSLIANGVEPTRIVAVPFGVDPEQFQPGGPRLEKTFRVLFVGQLSQRKGIKYLLEAFRDLRLPGAELVLVGSIVGSGRGLQCYRDVFQHIPNVPHSEVHQWFERADIFVYPSLHEGSALAIYEAMACGLPVITTPNSGSVVQDGIHGYIVPLRDVELLKEKILLLYENRELCQEMSRKARLRAEEFTWAAYRRRLALVVLNLLAAKG